MSREIKFRGKSKETEKWLYGDLIHYGKTLCIAPEDENCFDFVGTKRLINSKFEVIPETVGQFTGCVIYRKEMFDGDIITHSSRNGGNPHVVKWSCSQSGWIGDYGLQYPLVSTELMEIEIIGNIHENPELLK